MKKISKSKLFKKITGMLNIPLIIFLLMVGSLLLVSNMKSKPVKEAKARVNEAVGTVSKNLNNAASSASITLEHS
jgi:uncharacterized protein YpmB